MGGAQLAAERMVKLAVLAAVCALVCGPACHAADTGMPAGPPPAEQSDVTQNILGKNPTEERPGQPPLTVGGGLLDALPGNLLSEFHKVRQELKDIGITFSLHERSEVWADVSGGGHRGISYNGITVAKLNLDLDALFGWSGGELFTSAFDIHGHGPSRSFLGNQQLVSDIEATPSVKLYDLWLDQSLFDKKLSIRFGQEGANDEMMVTAYGGLFLNSSFGFPGMLASDLPSGGPNYPLASPFARALYSPSDKFTIVVAAYTSNPAPLGPGDPQSRDRNGTAFVLNDHTLGFAELWYTPDTTAPANLPTTYKIGAWYSSDNFNDQRVDNTGGLLASPTSTGKPLNHAGDWAVYGIVDQMVWQQPGTKDRGIGVFAQLMGGPSDRNLANLFAEGGMNWFGPFAARPKDVLGLAVSYLGISPAARAYSSDLVAFGRAASTYAGNETVIEATYEAPVTHWLTLQPDLQYVINPNAGIPNNFGSTPLPNALVIGIRATIRL
jgi:porin